MSPKNFFKQSKKNTDHIIFPVSNFAGLEAKIETEIGLSLGPRKILRSQSWSQDESVSTTALLIGTLCACA